MIACKTGLWYYNADDTTANKKYYSPLFRIKKKTATSKARLSSAFLNFTVWWEASKYYSKKTYTVNTNLRTGDPLKYEYIFNDETPDNLDFEVVAVEDKSDDGYTTYYVNSPGIEKYSEKPAQLTINKCDLLPCIEFLGSAPFDVDIEAISTDTHNLYRQELPSIGMELVEDSNVVFSDNSANTMFIHNGKVYVDCLLQISNQFSGSPAHILTLTGIVPQNKIIFYEPYVTENGAIGMCKISIEETGKIILDKVEAGTSVRLSFIWDSSVYTLKTTSTEANTTSDSGGTV